MSSEPTAPDLPPRRAHGRLAFAALLGLVLLAEMLVTLHPHFAIESVFGFHAAWGFVVCAGLMIVARLLAGILARPEGYYGRDDG